MSDLKILYAFAKNNPADQEYDFPNGDDKIAPEDSRHTVATTRIPKNVSAEKVVDQILLAAHNHRIDGQRGKVNILRLCAHGRGGGKLHLGGFGKGLDINQISETFERLRPLFTHSSPRREIKIHACYLGSDRSFNCEFPSTEVEKRLGVKMMRCPIQGIFMPKTVVRDNQKVWTDESLGYWFMQAMANATGANVHGGIDLIGFKGDYDFRFRGATLYCYPNKTTGLRLDYDDDGKFVEGTEARPDEKDVHDM